MNTMKKWTTGAMDKKMREEKEEEAERQKRKTSVIVHGISESKEKESERRVAEDESSISEVFAGFNFKVAVKKVITLGKREENGMSRPRPIKLVLENEEVRNALLKEAKNLKRINEGGLDKVFIHQDLTPKEREQRKGLLIVLKERQDKSKKNLMLFQGKIVEKRKPTKKLQY